MLESQAKLFIKFKLSLSFSYELEWEKNENEQIDAGIGSFKKYR